MRARVVLLTAVVLSLGCSMFSRTESSFYTIATVPGVRIVDYDGSSLAIEAIQLPPGLDRRGIVVRESGQQLDIRETEQWTDTLSNVVLHALAHDLAARVPEGKMVLPGQPKPSRPVRAVSVIFDMFSAGPDNRFVLDARWTELQSAQSFHEVIEVPVRSLESSEIANASSEALAALADRIVSRMAGAPSD